MTTHSSARLQGSQEDPLVQDISSALGYMAGSEAADEKGPSRSLMMPGSEPQTVLQESQLLRLAPSCPDEWEGVSVK